MTGHRFVLQAVPLAYSLAPTSPFLQAFGQRICKTHQDPREARVASLFNDTWRVRSIPHEVLDRKIEWWLIPKVSCFSGRARFQQEFDQIVKTARYCEVEGGVPLRVHEIQADTFFDQSML